MESRVYFRYDTHLDIPLESECRKKESELMLKKLQNNPQKPSPPVGNKMMRLLGNSNKDVKIDFKSAFKSVWVANSLGRSEDYLVSDKIFGLAGELMARFRTKMIAKPPPKTFKAFQLKPPPKNQSKKVILLFIRLCLLLRYRQWRHWEGCSLPQRIQKS